MRLSIRAKLVGSYALLLALTITANLVGMWAEDRADVVNTSIIEQSLPVSALVYKARSEVLEKGIAVRGFMISLDEASITQFYDIDKNMMATLAKARETFVNDESHRYIDEMISANDSYNSLVDEVVSMTRVGQVEEAMAKLTAGAQQLLGKLDGLIAGWSASVSDTNQQWLADADRTHRMANMVNIGGIVISTAIAGRGRLLVRSRSREGPSGRDGVQAGGPAASGSMAPGAWSACGDVAVQPSFGEGT